MSSLRSVFLAIILGGLTGFFLQENALYLKPFGDLFIKLIKMVIVPVIFFAILSGMTSAGNLEALKKVGVKAVLMSCLSTLCAVFIGFLSGSLLSPGKNIHLENLDKISPPNNQILDIVANIIPDNAIGAMASGNVIQVVFFALFTGYCLLRLPEETGKSLIQGTHNLAQLVFKMVIVIVKMAPLAAFAFTAWLVGVQGIQVIQGLAQLFFSLVFAGAVQFFVFALMIVCIARVSPWPFFKKSLPYQVIALSTTSTKAALVPAMRIAEESMGISAVSARFVLPLGATINMGGLAIYLGLCAVFMAQAVGKTLGFYDYGLIAFTATIGSIGGAGIPGAAIIMLPMVLSSVGLPLEGVALIASIDRIMDMIRSTISITGDVAVTLCVDDHLDRKRYHTL